MKNACVRICVYSLCVYRIYALSSGIVLELLSHSICVMLRCVACVLLAAVYISLNVKNSQ